MFPNLQSTRTYGMMFVSVAMALMVVGFALSQGSCRPFEEHPDEVDVIPPPSASQLVDSLIQSGNDLRRLDVLDIEGTAGLRSSERERMRTKILDVASGHARKYRDHLLELGRHSPQRVKDEMNTRLRSKGRIDGLPDIARVIDLHLRLVRADTPPSESRIIWDFGNLRYAQPAER